MPTLREARLQASARRRRARPCARPAAAPARLPRCRGGCAARPRSIERQQARPLGQIAAAGFLLATMLYGARRRRPDRPPRRLAPRPRRPRHRGRADRRQRGDLRARPSSNSWSSSARSSPSTWTEAQKRVAALPWVETAIVRKFYPGTLVGRDRGARALRALAARRRGLRHRRGRHRDRRRWKRRASPAAVPGRRAAPNADGGRPSRRASRPSRRSPRRCAPPCSSPGAAGTCTWRTASPSSCRRRTRRRGAGAARQARRASSGCSRATSIVVDLRLPDRVTVRLPEGRSLEEVTSTATPPAAKART